MGEYIRDWFENVDMCLLMSSFFTEATKQQEYKKTHEIIVHVT